MIEIIVCHTQKQVDCEEAPFTFTADTMAQAIADAEEFLKCRALFVEVWNHDTDEIIDFE